MSTSEIFVMAGIGMATGVFAGLFGVGGGVILVPTGLFFGTYFGARIANTLPIAYLKRAFALFLVFIAYRLW